MQQHLFEYAVIRVVPRVEREEFINIGIVLFCAKQKFLQCRYLLDEPRLLTFYAGLNVNGLKEHLCAFEKICLADEAAGPIARLDMASRFRWLTATRSTILQTSKVHPGICLDAAEMAGKLYQELVC